MERNCSQKELFLMEAMWTRVMPAMKSIQQIVKDGIIGKIRLIEADFGFQAPYIPDSRLLNNELGGGALMDVGIYPLVLAVSLLGKPESIPFCGNKTPVTFIRDYAIASFVDIIGSIVQYLDSEPGR